jgi:hypothetical protein
MNDDITASQIFREMSSPDVNKRIGKVEKEKKDSQEKSQEKKKKVSQVKVEKKGEPAFWIHIPKTIHGLIEFGMSSENISCNYVRIDPEKKELIVYATNFTMIRTSYHDTFKFYTGEKSFTSNDLTDDDIKYLKSLGTIYEKKETIICKAKTLYYEDKIAMISTGQRSILEVKSLEFEQIDSDRYYLTNIVTESETFNYCFLEFSFCDHTGKETIKINPRRVLEKEISAFKT